MSQFLPDATQFNVTIKDRELPSVHVTLTLHSSTLPDEARRLYLDRLAERVEDAVRALVTETQVS